MATGECADMSTKRIVHGKHLTWEEEDVICPICGATYVIPSQPADWKIPFFVPLTHPPQTCGNYKCNMEYSRRTIGYRLMKPGEATADWLKATSFEG